MRSTFSILFYINKNKIKKNGKCPIMGRITIDGKVSQFSVQSEIEPHHWSAKEGCVTAKSNDGRSINNRLKQVKSEIQSHYAQMIEKSSYVTAESVKNALQGIGTDQTMLLKEFEILNEEVRQSVGITRSVATYRSYVNALMNLKRFIRDKYQADDIAFNRLEYSFITDYDFYLKIDRGMATGSVKQHIMHLQKIMQRAVHKEIISRNPFADFVPDQPKTTRKWLSKEDLDKIMQTPIEHQSVNFVRNMFIFSTFTGLAYIDIKNLKWEHIITRKDGTKWIQQERTKSGSQANIPLLDIPLAIIDKHKGSGREGKVFDMLCMNIVCQYMKQISTICKLSRYATFHQSRHTYATQICLSQGVPIETLSRMMGHRNIRTTQIYAEITNQKIDRDMDILEQRIGGKYAVAIEPTKLTPTSNKN